MGYEESPHKVVRNNAPKRSRCQAKESAHGGLRLFLIGAEVGKGTANPGH